MSHSKFVDFRAVKAAVSMKQVLQRYGLLETLRGSGQSRRGPCPIHQGTNESQFSVNLSKGIWNCFSDCKCGGNHLDFVAKMENIDIHGAALLICEWFNVQPERTDQSNIDDSSGTTLPIQKNQSNSFKKNDNHLRPPIQKQDADNSPNKLLGFALKDLDPNHAYIRERGIDPATASLFGIGFFPGDKGLMTGRIAIPITNPIGQIVAYAGRLPTDPTDEEGKYRLPPGFKKRLEIYNLHRILNESSEQPFILVEGFFGCMKLWQLGCRKVVALMGSTMSDEQEALLRKHIHRDGHIVVMFDEDEAGRVGREEIAVRLARFAFVKIHVFDQEHRQPETLSAEELGAIIGGIA